MAHTLAWSEFKTQHQVLVRTGGLGNSHPLPMGRQNGAALWETVVQFLIKLDILLPCDPALALLGVYPSEGKTYVNAKTCTWVLITALFIASELGSNQHVLR